MHELGRGYWFSLVKYWAVSESVLGQARAGIALYLETEILLSLCQSYLAGSEFVEKARR